MDSLTEILYSNEVTWQTSLVRVVFSFFLGMVIGMERETHHQPAGMRTHILISIGATVVMLISIFIPQTFTDFQNGDPGRIAAQVVSGVGFLGAGAILKFGADIKGLTTAASIWAMAAIGMAAGAGMFIVSIIGVVIILFALIVMDLFEKKLFKERTLRKVELVMIKGHIDLQAVKKIFHENNVNVVSTGFRRNTNEANEKVTFMVAVTEDLDAQKLADVLEKTAGALSVAIEIPG